MATGAAVVGTDDGEEEELTVGIDVGEAEVGAGVETGASVIFVGVATGAAVVVAYDGLRCTPSVPHTTIPSALTIRA